MHTAIMNRNNGKYNKILGIRKGKAQLSQITPF
jgi:hypothetical protein